MIKGLSSRNITNGVVSIYILQGTLLEYEMIVQILATQESSNKLDSHLGLRIQYLCVSVSITSVTSLTCTALLPS